MPMSELSLAKQWHTSSLVVGAHRFREPGTLHLHHVSGTGRQSCIICGGEEPFQYCKRSPATRFDGIPTTQGLFDAMHDLQKWCMPSEDSARVSACT
jgi:hypothetical protein